LLVIPAVMLLIAAGIGATVASDEPSPSADPSVSPVSASPAAASEAPEPSPVVLPPGTFPLPEQVVSVPEDIPTVSIEPTSEPGLVIGTPTPFTLEHCGLLSPVDVDGSLWQPVAGRDAAGGPIDSDDEIGEFINATPGELALTGPDQAEFVTVTGQLIVLQRAPGALDYPLCM